MLRSILLTLTLLGSGACAALAHAGSVVIDGLGGPLVMGSKDFSGEVFGAGSPNFTDDAMRAVTQDLKSDGINVDRCVTFLLADTDDGLAWLTIVDDITQQGTGERLDAQMGMSTTGPDSANGYINDVNEDIDQFFDPNNGTQTYAGFFTWNADRQADGFAWGNLQKGDFVSFNFTRDGPDFGSHPGLKRKGTFQFVSWNGAEWEVLAMRAFSQRDDFAFSFTVIPLPAPALLGVVGLTALGVIRRRARAC